MFSPEGTQLLRSTPELSSYRFRYHSFMKIYRHLSCFDVSWKTGLESMLNASDSQCEDVRKEKQEYRHLPDILARAGNTKTNYHTIAFERHPFSQEGTLIGIDFTERSRRLMLCTFCQKSGPSLWGMFLTLAAVLAVGFASKNTPFPAFAFTAKFILDWASTKIDVSLVAALRMLEDAGLIKMSGGEYTMNSQQQGGRNNDMLL